MPVSWMSYTKMISSSMGDGVCQTLCFHTEHGWYHLEDSHLYTNLLVLSQISLLQLATLMCCPLHDSRLMNVLYCVHCFTTWFKCCGTHFEVIFQSCRSCCEIQSNVDPKLHVCLANPFTLQPLSLSVHCSITAIDVSVEMECLLWYLSAIYTLLHMNICPALQLSYAERHNHPVLHIAVHGTTVHFYSGQLLLSHGFHLRVFSFQMLPT